MAETTKIYPVAGFVRDGTPTFHGANGFNSRPVASEAGTKLIGQDKVPFWNMRWLQLGMCGRPSAIRFHLKKKGVPLRIEWDGGAELDSESRKGKTPRVMMMMSLDQARLLYELLGDIPGVGPDPFTMVSITKREYDLKLNKAAMIADELDRRGISIGA